VSVSKCQKLDLELETGNGNTTSCSALSGFSSGVFAPEFMTIRLQPQMKKYRCLW